jgi:hypothetical protein
MATTTNNEKVLSIRLKAQDAKRLKALNKKTEMPVPVLVRLAIRLLAEKEGVA